MITTANRFTSEISSTLYEYALHRLMKRLMGKFRSNAMRIRVPMVSVFMCHWKMTPGWFSTLHRVTARSSPASMLVLVLMRYVKICSNATEEIFFVTMPRNSAILLGESTVHMHIRNAQTILNYALDDSFVVFNPFSRLAGKIPPPKSSHYVTNNEFKKYLDAARPSWRLLFALC